MNQKILGDKRKSNFDDTLADVINKLYENQPEVTPFVIPSQEFYVEETDDFYFLHNIQLGDTINQEVIQVGWGKDLLNNGEKYTQTNWFLSTLNKKLCLPSSDLYFASLLALFENKEGNQAELIEKIRKMFFNDFNGDSGNNFIMTSSEVTYNRVRKLSNREDYVSHKRDNIALPSIGTRFSGVKCSIIQEGTENIEEPMKILFGTKDLKKIREVFKWISGKNSSRLCRLENNRKQKFDGIIDCPISMGVYGIGDYFSINAHLITENHLAQARGVIVEKIVQK